MQGAIPDIGADNGNFWGSSFIDGRTFGCLPHEPVIINGWKLQGKIECSSRLQNRTKFWSQGAPPGDIIDKWWSIWNGTEGPFIPDVNCCRVSSFGTQ
jgi:hypothetical protein